MYCSHCRRSLHPEDTQRLFVNNGKGGMEERVYCDSCGTARRRGAIPAVPLVAPGAETRSDTPEPAWYRLLNS